jgi:hypothetical protein
MRNINIFKKETGLLEVKIEILRQAVFHKT